MLRLRLRPEASSLVVSITATAARSMATSSRSAGCSTSINGNTLTATMPIGQMNASTSALLRRTRGFNATHMTNFSSTFTIPASQLRFVRAKPTAGSEDASSGSASSSSSANAEGDAKAENKANEGGEEKAEGEKAEGEEGADKKKKKAPPKPKTMKEQFQALKQDIKDFPDIYNSVNLVHFFIFTIFCLCSTGSNVEEQWWMRNWGIDKTFAPWAWPLHSLLTNNFLSMTFAMLLLHSMCHSAMTTLGPKLMWQYMAIIAVTSGAMIWGLNSAMGWSHEKQFGPWDVCSGLFVMQYLHQGMKPWQLILSFNGWVKYAMCVGSVCILYYDWQPVVFGTGVGLALCKLHPKLRSIKPPV